MRVHPGPGRLLPAGPRRAGPRRGPTRAKPLLLPLLLLLATCQDAAGPCDRPFACEVAGVDLYIPHLVVVTGSFDLATGLGIVDPDSVTIELKVRNRGDSASSPAQVAVRYGYVRKAGEAGDTLHWGVPGDTVAVPALRPGESFDTRIQVDAWEGPTQPRQGEWFDDTSYALADVLASDVNPANNRQRSARVHVRVAVLQLDLALPDTFLQVNVPFRARLTINNTSRHGALPPRAVGFWLCAWAGPAHCDAAGVTGFGSHDLAALPPSARYERAFDLTIPPGAIVRWCDTEKYYIIIQVSPPGTRDSLLWHAAQRLIDWDGRPVTVQPDFQACGPRLPGAQQPIRSPPEPKP